MKLKDILLPAFLLLNVVSCLHAQTPFQVKDINAGSDDGLSNFFPFEYNGVFLFSAKTNAGSTMAIFILLRIPQRMMMSYGAAMVRQQAP